MKIATWTAMLALALLGAAGAARAGQNLYLSPKDSSFQLKGTFTLFGKDQPLDCKITLSGMTTDGGDPSHAGSITGASARGSGCNHILFENLPYSIYLADNGGGTIGAMSFTLHGNTCSTGVSLAISRRGVWKLGHGIQCGMKGAAKSTPATTIARAKP